MVLLPLKDKDLCCSTLGFLNSLQNLDKKKAELISIASDGIISDHELKSWEDAEKLISNLIKNSFELLYRRGK
ncbi:hypothetical protein [Peptostreptococcus stomatis]|uniref:hypothetical protein n=1 Tax=Peptostreptococcus stomatis TaxID=341694 RepID=UPI0002EC371B|nr:hypothetical protein [Peptostreptococcus stomatis]